MPKPRTKRGGVREEKKRKRRAEPEDGEVYEIDSKRRRHGDSDNTAEGHGENRYPEDIDEPQDMPEKEFFGMLDEEDQELFRNMDEDLERNDFESDGERAEFMAKVFQLAKAKELKLASSQSSSRFLEKLIQRSNTNQQKQLFGAFAGHFMSLVQHRFASHCCEALFLQSAPAVTEELAGFDAATADAGGGDGEEQAFASSMEDLFLFTLDELEHNLSFLITDKFASHTLRVLLLVLSGRPLDDESFQHLTKSKKKENVVIAKMGATRQTSQSIRAVPSSFTLAVKKIIADTTSSLDKTGLQILAKHPIGNPTLQLLLELDLTMNKGDKGEPASLLQQILPGAPQSLEDESSDASQFINGMIYDPIGSRIIELLISQTPGKIFKALSHKIFLPRIQGYVRNDVASYAAIRVLNRLGKDDLAEAVDKILPTLTQLVTKGRFNVIRTLFERCDARGAKEHIKQLMKGLREGCGPESVDLITTLCCLHRDEETGKRKKEKNIEAVSRNEHAIQSHGAQLLTSLLAIPGPSKGVQEAILSISSEQLLVLAKTSAATVSLLTAAFETRSSNPAFHKAIVSRIAPHIRDLSQSQYGHNVVNAICSVPSKGKERSVPMHVKDGLMEQLGACEVELRESWTGRSVWRTWKGDLWKRRRGDWKAWMKEIDTESVGGRTTTV